MTDINVAGLGLDASVIERVQRHLAARDTMFLVVSGKQASGKDTIAPIVLSELGYLDPAHLSYAQPLKAETDSIIATLRSRFSTDRYPVLHDGVRREAAEVVADQFQMPEAQAAHLIKDLIEAARVDQELNARTRTPLMRFVLQYLGTDIRRAQDENYWVTRALKPAVETLERGRSVFFTDARFPNEVTMAQALGARAVRLDVSEEVQRARLLARDGINPDEDALTHKSETSLDSFADFDVRLYNEGPLVGVVSEIVTRLASAPAAVAV